jgi:alkylated DNA repair dioxygenase AlkB
MDMEDYPDLSIINIKLNTEDNDLDNWFKRALEDVCWEEGFIKIFGKTQKIPRLQAWYANKDVNYTYSGKKLKRNNWNEILLKIKKVVELETRVKFNSVLANLYRDGEDSMGLHSDNEKELGSNPVIASLSLGATRKIFFRHKYKKISFSIAQNQGDLLIMSGQTQSFWKHEIKKEKKVLSPRVNLTFRNIIG